MRLTTIMLARLTAGVMTDGGAAVQAGTSLGLAPSLRGIAPILFDREDDMITKTFQSVLNREPTGNELRQYQTLIENYEWNESDIRRDLRDRPDYQHYSTNRRGIQPEAIVR